MQEWLSKSGQANAGGSNAQNTSMNISQHQHSQQQFMQMNDPHSIDPGFAGGSKKFIQQQMGLNSA